MTEMQATVEAPLAGIRVLELGNFLAAPFGARIFGDFGAEVIKVERPGIGDEVRGWRLNRGTTSMMFRTIARNKKSVTLDLHTEIGRKLALDLIRESDVVMENFRPGTLERWGLGPDQMTTVNPDIVLVRISGYGQTGPYRDRAGFGGVGEAVGGFRHVTGHPESESVRPGAAVGDTLAGLYGAVGALMLLLARKNGRRHDGPRVADVALYESVYMAMDSLVPDLDAYDVVRQRTAANLPGVVPAGIFPTAEGQSVMICANSYGPFTRLMKTIGRNDLANDATLASNAARHVRVDEIEGAITDWTQAHSLTDAVDILSDAGVPAGPINDATAIANDRHFKARGMVQPVKIMVEDELEEIRFPGVVPVIPGVVSGTRWLGPELGEHTDQVFGELLELTPEQIATYREQGVI